MDTTYRYTDTDNEKVSDHAGHAWEEWHAYLSSDVPVLARAAGWLNVAASIERNATGLCCHTCRVIVLDLPYRVQP